MSTFHDLIQRPRQYIEKSQADTNRFFTPPDALVGRPSPSGFVRLVVDDIKRKMQGGGNAPLQGEKVFSDRRPTFVDLIVNRRRGFQTRRADDYDAAIESDDTDVETFAAWLAAQDEGPQKSYDDVKPGDFISKGVNISAAIRRGVADVMRR